MHLTPYQVCKRTDNPLRVASVTLQTKALKRNTPDPFRKSLNIAKITIFICGEFTPLVRHYLRFVYVQIFIV